MTYRDGTPSTVSEMLAAARQELAADIKAGRPAHTCGRHCGPGYHPDRVTVALIEQSEGGFRTRRHRGFGHGLRPGEDRDLGCPSCTREDRNTVPCPDCGGGYWQEYIGPPAHASYIPHDSICPAVAS